MTEGKEVARLRDCLNDLAGIMALPALRTSGEPRQIVTTLLDALLATLRLAFVFVRLNDPEGGPPIEMMRVEFPRKPSSPFSMRFIQPRAAAWASGYL